MHAAALDTIREYRQVLNSKPSLKPITDKMTPAARQAAIDENLAIMKAYNAKVAKATGTIMRDPVAVRIVNVKSDEPFKKVLKNNIEAIREDTEGAVIRSFKKYGIDPKTNKIEIFAPTNPRPPEKVNIPADWDFTLRINGVDVPPEYAEPIVHEAFYRAVTGEGPPSREVAAKFAEEHGLVVTWTNHNEAYGYAQSEIDFFLGKGKLKGLRDPAGLSEVMNFKSRRSGRTGRETSARGESTRATGQQASGRGEKARGGREGFRSARKDEGGKESDK